MGSSSEPPGERPVPRVAAARRGRRYVLASLVMVTGIGLFLGQFFGWFGDSEGSRELRRVVFPLKKRPQPARLAIEYHYDRNAMVDSRLVGSSILGLAAAGNLVVFDAESFALRGEKVLSRRATCLGPVEEGHALVGIANGTIVRVAIDGLGFELVGEVPGVPRWIGKPGKHGGLLVAHQVDASGNVRLQDLSSKRGHALGVRPALFLDSQDRLWIASADRLRRLDLGSGAEVDLELKGGWAGVLGLAELSDGQVWAFGGKQGAGESSSFIARVAPGPRPTLLFAGNARRPAGAAPSAPITHVLEAATPGQVMVVSHDSVVVTDSAAREWKPLEAMAGGRRQPDAMAATGQAHRTDGGLLLTLARGGFMEVTADRSRRHVLEGQYAVVRPSEIVRLEKGVAFFGDGHPSFYVGGAWRALPDPVMPSSELLGLPRPGETERVWAAMLTIPLDGESSYVLAKAGVPRHYLGHIHGLRDTFLTARWDGTTLATLGREDLPIEPADTFATPDKRLWNVDDQGLWSFSGGRWKLVMRSNLHGTGAVHARSREAAASLGQSGFRTAIGEPLHFAASASPPFYGLPTSASSWALVRLDQNDEGGVPLIEELPVLRDGRRLLIHDLVSWEGKPDELLLATDQGLCVFDAKWATCEPRQPAGLTGQVTLFMRDRAGRLWLGGRGLWGLRDPGQAVAMHLSIPMAADTRVVALAEAPDGRLVVGLEDRGVVFLTLPEGWLAGPPELRSMAAPWEAARAHEPAHADPSLVLRLCRAPAKGAAPDPAVQALVAELRAHAGAAEARTRVEIEIAFEGMPDFAVRGSRLDKLESGVLPLLAKHPKAPVAAWRREGPRGAPAVQIKHCTGF